MSAHTCHPEAMTPVSDPASSTTYRLHVPFALNPLKSSRLTFPLGVGAGAGNTSPVPKFRGWYDPAAS
jgi:hypothetical protein